MKPVKFLEHFPINGGRDLLSSLHSSNTGTSPATLPITRNLVLVCNGNQAMAETICQATTALTW
jgi:hypothetical protein